MAIVIAGFAIQFQDVVDITLTAPKENLTTFFVDGDPSPVFLGGHLELLGYLLLLPFAAALYRHLRSAEPVSAFGALTSILAVTAFVATTLSPGFAAGAAALWIGSHGGDPASVEALNTLRNTTYVTSLAAYAFFFAAVGVSGLTGRSLPKWLSVPALVLAGWLAVGLAFFTDGQADLPAMVGLLWSLAAAIWMVSTKISSTDGARAAQVPAVSPA
ncbi:hypothetical protein ACFQX7_31740 [Luedemannella flava]